MSKKEATKMLRERSEDAEWSAEEFRAVFRALYGRAPDADDEAAGILSLCYAA